MEISYHLTVGESADTPALSHEDEEKKGVERIVPHSRSTLVVRAGVKLQSKHHTKFCSHFVT